MEFLKSKLFVLIILIVTILYIICTFAKLLYCNNRIKYGKQLDKKLSKFSDNINLLNQLFPELEHYCNQANIKLLPKIYNLYNAVNLLNKQVQQTMHNSINRAIGVYSKRRRYCYILFTIKNNNKSTTVGNTFFSKFVECITTFFKMIIKFLESM